MREEAPKQLAASRSSVRRLLVVYDFLVYAVTVLLLLVAYREGNYAWGAVFSELFLGAVCVFFFRGIVGTYREMWRYMGVGPYLRLLAADGAGFVLYYCLDRVLAAVFKSYRALPFARMLAIVCISLLGCIAMRLLYQGLYRYCNRSGRLSELARLLLVTFGGVKMNAEPFDSEEKESRKIRIAIVGAGQVGVSLATELQTNPHALYKPVGFIDINEEKIGRRVSDLPVWAASAITAELLAEKGVQEVVVALPQQTGDEKKVVYDHYVALGCRVKIYDYPTVQASGRRTMREFDIEDLLFRKPVALSQKETFDYYRDKVVLITGGGGSIGSELCRQVAKAQPKKLVVLDVYENGAYDVQQELHIKYKGALNLCVEIVSVCDRRGLETVFAAHRPQVVLHAAAHKHVPLMEHNCCEAVKNNVFGTLNVVELAEQYGVERVMMVSTDKAVNPTNVMGATKRMCEMIVLSHSQNGTKTTYSATRFGNVLGSAGSVIPLFKRQIREGGPVTITDKRIIRYFMTIPEASQLVLRSGAMAKNGELFVLDMGKPVKILELAENMIRLSGFEPYRDIDIVETGLRPGEKLYEELLIKTEELDSTESDLIFIERDTPLTAAELDEKLASLRAAVATEDDAAVRAALRKVVPTFRTPEEVNTAAQHANA